MTHIASTPRYSFLGVQPGAAQDSGIGRRVRSESARIAVAVTQGIEGSATFRRLVDTIDTTDGLVYVGEGVCGHGVRACLLLSVTVAGPNRVLRILVNPRKAPGCELVEMIGHELQHAIEVLGNPRVRTGLQAYNFFDVVGRTSAGRFETEAAMQAGLAVAGEGCRRR
jgi:hypothetical protein